LCNYEELLDTLKYLDHAVQQIQSLLQLHIKNIRVQETIKQQENQLQLFINNSEIIYGDPILEGIIKLLFLSWTKHLGHEIKDGTGQKK
jgi:hypothetical protein